MDGVARVVLALEAPEVTEEVLHFLDRSGKARVVATATDDRQLTEAVRQTEPDVVVAEPSLALDGVDGAALLAIATRESVAALRGAVRAGARGFFVWPAERDGLLDGVAGAVATRRALTRRAAVVAVHASRGGAGCTFVATHLAQAFAARGATCVLIDADPWFGDVATALGATSDDVRTLADLAPVADELTWEHVEEAAFAHSSGVQALLAPPPDAVLERDPVPAALDVAASVADVVVAPSAAGSSIDRTMWCLGQADRVFEVLSLDVLSFRATSRALSTLGSLGSGGSARVRREPSQARRAHHGRRPTRVRP